MRPADLSRPASRAAPADPSPPEDVCAHCGSARRGRYCATCGQRHRDGRLTVSSLFRRFILEAFDLEDGALGTFVKLIIRPGDVVRDYWRGATQSYINPVRYFLFLMTLAQLAAWQSGVLDDAAEGFVGGMDDPDFQLSVTEVVTVLVDYFVVLVAFSLPFVVLYATVRTGRNVAEHAVLSLFAYAQGAFFFSVATMLAVLLSSDALEFSALVIGPAVYLYTYVRSLERSWYWSLLHGLIALTMAVLTYVFFVGMAIGFTVSFATALLLPIFP